MKKFKLFRATEDLSENFHPGEPDFSFLGDTDKHKKCLPAKIAGELGWDLKMPETITVRWNGGNSKHDVTISKAERPENRDLVSAAMGYGVISFKIPYLVDLEEGNFLWIRGAANNPLSLDLLALEGVVESDWFPGHITMNYRILTPNKDIELEAGKSYCRMVPYPKNYIETFSPTWNRMEEDVEFSERYENYTIWNRFSMGAKQYMRSYMLGYLGDKRVDHCTKVRLSTPSGASRCPFAKG